MKITTLIIDDDVDSRLILSSYIRDNCPDILVVGEAETVEAGIMLTKKERPDLLLLDISLPDGTGFDLLKQLPEKQFEVIFITAFDKFAIEAFRCSAIDYLLKPVAFADLKEALQRLKNRMEEKYFNTHWMTLAHNIQHRNTYEKRLAIATANGYIFIDINEIVRLESHSNYTHFYFKDGKKMISSHTLGYYEDLLPEEKFCRIHNSHLVNIDFIDRYTKGGVGGTIVMKDGMELGVSQRKKEIVVRQLISNSSN
ncbi:MAG TPA: LytTR family DNA-binding domain-containing protein [Ferruginibacter sp.]|nr:LytTR family DNA-binding domain-containing protein [Ferruginibacter sp.]